MSVDKFGRASFHLQQKHGFFEASNELEEFINAKKRRIINVEPPIDKTDATNKEYVDEQMSAVNFVSYNLSDLYSTLNTDESSTKASKIYTTVVRDSLRNFFLNDKRELIAIVEEYIKNYIEIRQSIADGHLTSKDQDILQQLDTLKIILLQWAKEK